MKDHWRRLASLTPAFVEKKIYDIHFRYLHKQWEKGDRSLPPSHLVKQRMVKQYAAEGKHEILVETGTYMGDMIFAMQDVFRKIYSIELSPFFYQKALKRFKKYKHIKLTEGDSGKVLEALVPTLDASALFWLDGHYSGGTTALGDKECPIYEELSHILKSPLNHSIIIDDARLFVGKNDYPTVDDLQQFVSSKKPQSHFQFENDAIIITIK